MKKSFLCAAGALLIAAFSFMFTSCATTDPYKVDYQLRGMNRSPENSVVFCFYFLGSYQMTFTQTNPEFGEDIQNLTGKYVISAPCEPGSYYHCSYINGYISYGEKYTWSQTIPLEYQGLDIKVPSKPGLYYVGFFDSIKTLDEGTYREMTDDPFTCFSYGIPKDELNRKKVLLKHVKQTYKGTSWEVFAGEELERINELTNR